MAVALVGNGTVSVVGVIPVARAWARITPFRVKFTIGSPKPRFAKPVPLMANVAGGVARSIAPGVIPPRLGGDCVTVRAVLPSRL